MSSTNRGAERSAGDFYRTPEWVIRAILPHLPASDRVLDPCCGDGAILEVLRERLGITHISGIELDAPRAELARQRLYLSQWLSTLDALAIEWSCPYLVVMNPPYRHAEQFVRKALAEVAPGGSVFALLRVGFMGSLKRADLWRDHPADVYVLPRRPSFTGGRTDSCDYAWFAWGPGRGGRWSRLEDAE
jgi:hypothetical protein